MDSTIKNNLVSPTGFINLYSENPIDVQHNRSREEISKDDLSYYFNHYLVPKYGLDNINVNNVGSFMKDLEMNWSRLTPDLKNKVLDILVDGIFSSGNYDFKTALMNKVGATQSTQKFTNVGAIDNNNIPINLKLTNTINELLPSNMIFKPKQNFSNTSEGEKKKGGNRIIVLLILLICLIMAFYINK